MTLCFISINLRVEIPKDCIVPSKHAQMLLESHARDAQWSLERECELFLYQVRPLVSEIELVMDNL